MENPCRIVCFGDSITHDYCAVFSKRIAKEYINYSIEVINEGVISDTTIQALQRIDKIIDYRPDVIIVGFGMNDWRKGVSKFDFIKNYKRIIEKLKTPSNRVILNTINPNINPQGKVDVKLIEYNTIIKNLAFNYNLRIVDIFSLWMRTFPNIRKGLSDEIHPNKKGYELITEALMRVVPRGNMTIVWAFNSEEAFCNYSCEYCYVPSSEQSKQNFKGTITEWHDAIKKNFGEQKITFYFSFGEPMAGKGFYKVLDMISSEPNWEGHMTTNLSLPLTRFVQTELVKSGRMHVNASFHPTQTKKEDFLKQLMTLRNNGIEPPIVFVMWPPLLKRFEEYFNYFNKYNFLIHVRRYRGIYNNKWYPRNYNDEERKFIAKYCDDATIKYMLNELELPFGKGVKGELFYGGMFYVLLKSNGDIWVSPDHNDCCLGNIFTNSVRLYTEPMPYNAIVNGAVDGLANFLKLGYKELEGNHVLSFAKQGGVYHTENGVFYKNMGTNFDDQKTRKKYGFPTPMDKIKSKLSMSKEHVLFKSLKSLYRVGNRIRYYKYTMKKSDG